MLLLVGAQLVACERWQRATGQYSSFWKLKDLDTFCFYWQVSTLWPFTGVQCSWLVSWLPMWALSSSVKWPFGAFGAVTLFTPVTAVSKCATIQSSPRWVPLGPSSFLFHDILLRHGGCEENMSILYTGASHISVGIRSPTELVKSQITGLTQQTLIQQVWGRAGGFVSLMSSHMMVSCRLADLTSNSTIFCLPFEFLPQIPSHSVLWAVSFPFSQILSSLNSFLMEESSNSIGSSTSNRVLICPFSVSVCGPRAHFSSLCKAHAK